MLTTTVYVTVINVREVYLEVWLSGVHSHSRPGFDLHLLISHKTYIPSFSIMSGGNTRDAKALLKMSENSCAKKKDTLISISMQWIKLFSPCPTLQFPSAWNPSLGLWWTHGHCHCRSGWGRNMWWSCDSCCHGDTLTLCAFQWVEWKNPKTWESETKSFMVPKHSFVVVPHYWLVNDKS